MIKSILLNTRLSSPVIRRDIGIIIINIGIIVIALTINHKIIKQKQNDAK